MNEHIPTRMIGGNDSKPWINRRIQKLMRKRDRLFRRLRNGETSLRERYKAVKKRIQRDVRTAYNNHINTIISEPAEEYTSERPKTNKSFWTFIKSLKRDSTGVSPLKDNGILFADPGKKASILNSQYSSVFTKDDGEDLHTLPKPKRQLPNIDVTTEGITKLLQQINPSKASGPDNIPARFLKDFSTDIAPILQVIFNRSLHTGELPTSWLSANVAAVFKKGERCKASNYRPVSLTCITCKILEHIVVSNIMKHLEKHKALVDVQQLQHGFRKGRSCETQLIHFIEELARDAQGGGQTDAIVMDFSKAFDKVSHPRLLYKLKGFGIDGQVHAWIKNFLVHRVQRVVVDGEKSEEVDVKSGVPQGTVLGPILFLLFINDMPEHPRHSKIRLFADDCVIYRKIATEDDCDLLQEDLKSLEKWEETWKMEFNPSKCFSLNVTRKRNKLTRKYTLRGSVLQNVDRTEYLGVTIQSDLRWNSHIDKIVNKANRNLGMIRRNIKTNCSKAKERAFNSLVRPNLEYACSAWDPTLACHIDRIQAVQRRGARYVCNRYHNTSSPTSMLQALKWEPLASRRIKLKLCIFFKIHYKQIDVKFPPYVHLATERSRRAHSATYSEIQCQTDYYQDSFFPSTISAWNSLSPAAAEATSLDLFKARLSTLTL